jgi:4-hydroxy-2-oxoheptanedioate aldolase
LGRYREGLAAGRQVVGAFCCLDGYSVAHILASAGFDFLIFDRQHAAYSWPELENLCFRVRSTGASAFIRTASAEEAEINLALDQPIEGIVIPNVASAAEARAALRRAKWPPQGIRSLGNERNEAIWRAYSEPDPLVGFLIEHPGAVDEIDEILALGVDFIWIGTHDLSALLGFDPHEVVDRGVMPPPLLKAMERVRVAAERAGVVLWGAMGAKSPVSIGGVDARLVRQAAEDALRRVRGG